MSVEKIKMKNRQGRNIEEKEKGRKIENGREKDKKGKRKGEK